MKLYALTTTLIRHEQTKTVRKPILGWRRADSQDSAIGNFYQSISADYPDFLFGEILCVEIPENSLDNTPEIEIKWVHDSNGVWTFPHPDYKAMILFVCGDVFSNINGTEMHHSTIDEAKLYVENFILTDYSKRNKEM